MIPIRLALACLLAAATVAAADVTGVWRYDGMPDSTVIICQDGAKLVIAAQHALDGKPSAIISYGTGTIEGTKITVEFKVVRRPNPTWGGSNGLSHQDLVLSADGSTITGTWRNDNGSGTAAALRRVN